jgi:hypothetical protein
MENGAPYCKPERGRTPPEYDNLEEEEWVETPHENGRGKPRTAEDEVALWSDQLEEAEQQNIESKESIP